MANLKDAVKSKLFGGKVRFMSDETQDVVSDALAPEVPVEEVSAEAIEEAKAE